MFSRPSKTLASCQRYHLKNIWVIFELVKFFKMNLIITKSFLNLNLAPSAQDLKSKSVNGDEMEPPMYARAPNFQFKFSYPKKAPIVLKVQNKHSYKETIKQLVDSGQLDDTQAKAAVASLTREIALIEGPPGTGKTYLGVHVVKVLAQISLGPILTICYTK